MKAFLLSLVFVTLATVAYSQTPILGRWEGTIKIAGGEIAIQVEFTSDTSATIDIPAQRRKGLQLINVGYRHPNIHFELPSNRGLAVFEGSRSAETVSGDFSQGGAKGTFVLSQGGQIPSNLKPIVGPWSGAIGIMGQRLSIEVEFKIRENKLAADISIPVQNAFGLVLQNVTFDHPNVHFELPAGSGLAVFDGVLTGDSIAGKFLQAGVAGMFSLTHGRLKAEAEKEESLPYRQEEVSFNDDSIKLAGTLTLPATAGPHPAVILITGSGPQNRDEELFGFKPFRIIADHLTRKGIAVLRTDDRGVGGSTGSTMQSTTDDFARDALAAVAYLKTRSDINPTQIGLCGHSEGGIVAPLAAGRSKDVAFIILLSGTGVNGAEVILKQSELIARANGEQEAEIKRSAELTKKSFDLLRAGKNLESIRPELETAIREELAGMKPEDRRSITNDSEFVKMRVDAMIRQSETAWLKYFINFEPTTALEIVRCPVLMVFGGKDLQVSVDQNRGPMEAALKRAGNSDVTVHVFAEANHLYLTATTGSPNEYVALKKEFVPGFLDTISDWLLKRVTVAK